MKFEETRKCLWDWGIQHNLYVKNFDLLIECGETIFEIDLETKIYDEIDIKIKNPKSIQEAVERLDKIFIKGE